MTLRIGDRVTGELKCRFDGLPVPNWPNPQYVGTIEKVRKMAGIFYAYVRYDSGRHSYESLDDLTIV